MQDKVKVGTPGTTTKAERVQAGRAYFEAWKARRQAKELLLDVAATERASSNDGSVAAPAPSQPEVDPRLHQAKALLQAAQGYDNMADNITATACDQLSRRICSVDEVIARVRERAAKKGHLLSPVASDTDRSPLQLKSQLDQQHQHTNEFVSSLDAWLTQVEAGMHLALRQEQQMRADLMAAQEQQHVFKDELQAAHKREEELKRQLATAVRAIHNFNAANVQMKERALGMVHRIDSWTCTAKDQGQAT